MRTCGSARLGGHEQLLHLQESELLSGSEARGARAPLWDCLRVTPSVALPQSSHFSPLGFTCKVPFNQMYWDENLQPVGPVQKTNIRCTQRSLMQTTADVGCVSSTGLVPSHSSPHLTPHLARQEVCFPRSEAQRVKKQQEAKSWLTAMADAKHHHVFLTLREQP